MPENLEDKINKTKNKPLTKGDYFTICMVGAIYGVTGAAAGYALDRAISLASHAFYDEQINTNLGMIVGGLSMLALGIYRANKEGRGAIGR